MSAKDKVIKDLQKGLSMELSAVNQYLLHALITEDWGLDKLAAKMREEMQEGAWSCRAVRPAYRVPEGQS